MEKRIIKDWIIKEKIGSGSFAEVYKAEKNDGSICAVKYFSLPKNQDEIDKLFKEGFIRKPEDITIYYGNIITNIKKELEIMKKLANSKYILNYYDFFEEEKNGKIKGYDFYIFMEYAEDITKYYQNKEITTNDVIKLGIDICKALELCSNNNIIHNDIKPNNIFVDSSGNYKLGDFGIASNIKDNNFRNYATLDYMAPEVYKNENVDITTDMYSLGLVMYKLINGKLPFVTNNSDEKEALKTRMLGTQIPAIKTLNNDIMNILYKALAYNKKERYKNAIEMRKDLEKITNISSTKKSITFNSALPSDTIDIYDEKIITNLPKKNKYIELIKNKPIFNKIRNYFSDNTFLKITMLILITSILLLLLIKGCSLNRKCKDGYINKNGSCVKGYYYCENGYTLNDNNKCQKTIESIEAKATYTCKENYTLTGDICVYNDVRDPKFVYKCADGFTLKDQKCEKVESADAVVVYTCPTGYISSGDKCFTVTNTEASVKYTCPDSYTLSGNTCKKNTTSTVKATIKYSCSSGTLNGSNCDHTTTPYYYWCSQGTYNYADGLCHYTTPATKSYQCTEGTSDGNGNCIIASNTTISPNKEYSCPSGYTVINNQCAKTSGISANSKYICSDDSTLKGNKCYATITTDAVGMYECDEGFVISGAKCYKNSFPKPIIKYTCSKVYTLNGKKCEKYEIINAKAHYDE